MLPCNLKNHFLIPNGTTGTTMNMDLSDCVFHSSQMVSGTAQQTYHLPILPLPPHPEWMALYDVTDMAAMNTETYLRLRGPEVKTDREKETMAQIKVDRKLYDYISGREIDWI